MRVVVTGGGTGGHIFPALAIANALDAEILYIGGEKGIEKDILPDSGFKYKLIDVEGFKRKLSIKNVAIALKALTATKRCRAILREFKPDVVVATGGYVSGPVGQAAAGLKIPLFLQEQNSYPGVTVRLLAKKARAIFLGSKGAEKYLPKHKCMFTGNPVRREIVDADRKEARRRLQLEKKTLLLVTGGSQGSQAINEAVRALYPKLKKKKDLVVVHHTGWLDYPDVKSGPTAYPVLQSELGQGAKAVAENIFITPFIKGMATFLAASDLVVSRAGAIFLSEAAVLGVPLIMIPFPHAADNHQTYNARVWEENGAGLLIPEAEISSLEDKLLALLDDPSRRKKMAERAKTLGNPTATEAIVREIMSLA